MLDTLKKITGKWWLAVVLGILAIACSVMMIANTFSTFEALSTIVSILFIIVGIIEIASTIANRKQIPAWGWNLAGAIIITLVAIMVLTIPGEKETFLITLFQVGFLFEGIYLISNSIQAKQLGIKGWGWLLALGIITTLLGLFILFGDSFGIISAEAISFMAACAMMTTGIELIIAGILMSKVKGVVNQIEEGITETGKQIEEGYKKVEKEIEDSYKKAEKEFNEEYKQAEKEFKEGMKEVEKGLKDMYPEEEKKPAKKKK